MPAAVIKSIRLSDLASAVRQTLDEIFLNNTHWVVADVTNHTFKKDKNYHHLELVEKSSDSTAVIARMQAKAWGNGAAGISAFESSTGQRFTNNIQVLVNVSVTYHAVFGLQLEINAIDTNFTIGRLEQQRRATLLRLLQNYPDAIQLSGDRYVTRNQQLPLNKVIQRVAVISSSTSAGWQDFHAALGGNSFGYRFLVDDYFTAVQGEANAGLFVNTLVQVFNTGIPYDAVVIIRGGGAQADFQLFDEYVMGRVIAKYPIPVITGIGHQKNETITDLMAHTQTRTPTQAAEFIAQHNRSFEVGLSDLQNRIVIRSQQAFAAHLEQLSRVNATIVYRARNILFSRQSAVSAAAAGILSGPRITLAARRTALENLQAEVTGLTRRYMTSRQSQLGYYLTFMKLMSPRQLLKRGFAIVKVNNSITADPAELQPGSTFTLLFGNEAITASVIDKTLQDGNTDL